MSGLQQIFGWLCHQLPSRSPHFGQLTFPLCYRCAGVHLGFAASFLSLLLRGGWRRRLPGLALALGLAVLLVPLMVDGWGNLLGWWSSPGWLRACTGLAAGVSLPLLLVPLLFPEPTQERRSSSVSSILSLGWPAALGVTLLVLLTHPAWPVVFQGLAVVALAGTILFVSCLLRAVWCIWALAGKEAAPP
jgi:uncharacterized membrane protein